MEVVIEDSWRQILKNEFDKDYFGKLTSFIREEYKSSIVYPSGKHIFAAFDHCSFSELKVVILGQDPYHGAGQAHGLCFSVQKGVKTPPSLVNVYKELARDLQMPIPSHGCLTSWAEQGVLLLNATLTVRANEAGSHQKKGWEEFTDAVIKSISDHKEGVVFLLWGNYAQSKAKLINANKHLVLKSVHPSPLSAHRGFIGCGHFSQANNYLTSLGKSSIEWKINE